jgi:hypothetical protein
MWVPLFRSREHRSSDPVEEFAGDVLTEEWAEKLRPQPALSFCRKCGVRIFLNPNLSDQWFSWEPWGLECTRSDFGHAPIASLVTPTQPEPSVESLELTAGYLEERVDRLRTTVRRLRWIVGVLLVCDLVLVVKVFGG